MTSSDNVVGRRDVLKAAGAVGLASIAGCSGLLDDGDGETTPGTTTDTAPYEVPRGQERIERVFQSHIDEGLHHGAQLAVFQDGEQVVDLAGGTTGPDGEETTTDQRFLLFSCTKPLAAACVHHLIDEGEIALEDRIVDHWPDYAEEGSEKAQATVRHSLSHQTGLPAVPIDEQFRQWGNPDAIASSVEEAELLFSPGETAVYHLLSFGWINGELVRQVTGERIDRYAKANVFDPLGMDQTGIGLAEGEPDNIATLTGYDPIDRVEGRVPEPSSSNQEVAQLFNQEFIHRAVIPAANGLSTASDMARFYQTYLNGGSIGETDFIGSDLVDEATTLQVEAPVENSESSQRYGLGFVMGGGVPDSYGISVGPGAYGHGGLGTSVTWADPDLGLTFAYVVNGIRDDPTTEWRRATMSEAVREELA